MRGEQSAPHPSLCAETETIMRNSIGVVSFMPSPIKSMGEGAEKKRLPISVDTEK